MFRRHSIARAPLSRGGVRAPTPRVFARRQGHGAVRPGRRAHWGKFNSLRARSIATAVCRLPSTVFVKAQIMVDAAPKWSSVKILVVDDDEGMRALFSRMLRRMKVGSVIEADGAESALALIEAPTAGLDAIICDWNMPGMSGMELFERTQVSKPELPFLMVTGRSDVDSVIAAKKAGVSAYIVKPVSYQELQKKLAFLIADESSNGRGEPASG